MKKLVTLTTLLALTSCAHQTLNSNRSVASLNGITLTTKDLEKNFIVTGVWEKGTSSKTFLRSRSVKFVLSGENIEVVDNAVDGLGVMYAFPILARLENGYKIDVNAGFNKIYFQAPIYIRSEAVLFPESYKLKIFPVPGMVEKVLSRTGDNISLDLNGVPVPKPIPTLGEGECKNVNDQYCEMVYSEVSSPSTIATSFHIRFAPEQKAEKLQKKADTEGHGVGFYATFPDSENKSYIGQRDITKPIVWYVDAPKDMYRVVEEAANYWNLIFTKEVIKIKPLTSSIDIWQPYINSIVFYANDPSGGAAGVFSIGPDSMVVNGHIYVPNGFVEYGKSSFSYYETDLKKEGWSAKKIVEARDRFVHDYEVQTFAHELGHSLGLRHNFKGTTQNNMKDYAASLSKYIRTGKIPEYENPSSSLMDYTNIDSFVLIGAKIRKAKEGKIAHPELQYDKYAVNWGYNPKTIAIDSKQAGPYCDLPEAYAQAPYKDENDATCASWDDPQGVRIIRVELGTQLQILYGTSTQIKRKCETAFDIVKIENEKPVDLSLSPTGDFTKLRKTNGEPFATKAEVCEAIELILNRKK